MAVPEAIETEDKYREACEYELHKLQESMESIEFETLVASRLNVLDKEFGSISDRFHVTPITYTPLFYTPEGLPPTPLRAVYGYGLTAVVPDGNHLHFLALGYSIQTSFKDVSVPIHNLLLSSTYTPEGEQDIITQLRPYLAQSLEAQRLLHPTFAKGAKKMIDRRYAADKPYSGSYTSTQEIVTQLTQSPKYTDKTYGLGTSVQGDRLLAEVALDTFLIDVLSSGKIT